jgi:hypothetical protein
MNLVGEIDVKTFTDSISQLFRQKLLKERMTFSEMERAERDFFCFWWEMKSEVARPLILIR